MIHNLLIHKGVAVTPQVRASLPVRFNNPFSYIPCGLCREAAGQVMEYLQGRTDWEAELHGGKMFGVLVVETQEGELGYLAAFSGNLQGRNNWEFFVPPVYDLLLPDEFFKVGEREISALNSRIASAESSGELVALKGEIVSVQGRFEEEIARLKEIYADGKKERERMREELEDERAVGEADAVAVAGVESAVGKGELLARMVRESQFQKAEIKRAEKRMREALDPLRGRLAGILNEIEGMKELRKVKSAALQEEIFRHFVFFNARGEKKDLLEIFKDYYSGEAVLPPGGAGECAAPKLLQYAYIHGMRPVAMGEFWYGDSPKGEIRHHGEFYPSCKGKCAPILGFMLQGLDADEAGVHSSYGQAGSFEILYSDERILAVNKPAGVLSQDSLSQGIDVFKLLSFSENLSGEKLYVVHRLDMHTSGVLLLTRSEGVYKELQRQFAAREVEKVYYAVLEGEVTESGCGSAISWDAGAGPGSVVGRGGIISLPLLPDYNNRPAQMVDLERGKEAVTRFRILKIENGRTYVEFRPVTGRTHQLRVHSAHRYGLNAPIVGDLLYGTPAERLMLHAYSVKFRHPVNGGLVEIVSPVPERAFYSTLT
ncbi:MAG: RluA family pseudouridine synthase [Bacteroidales bacterium]|nr:RluA family pseudouridine synthase [Bacteroidales bacterium]